MTDRQHKLHWMRDILDHLRRSQEQLPLADDLTQRYLAESMKRDLDEFRRLCDSLIGKAPPTSARAAA
ncbi:MAG: hypothetical protein JNG90_12060 [Planctomycetaceae bacterium]|nr:hypothetical protein [Planctomycetaceae bacterium]